MFEEACSKFNTLVNSTRVKDARTRTQNRCLATADSTQAHKRFSKMAKSKESILLPDFGVNYILNGFMTAYLPYFLAHFWKQNRFIHIFHQLMTITGGLLK